MICMFGGNVKGKKEMLINLFILVVNIIYTCGFQATMIIVSLSVVMHMSRCLDIVVARPGLFFVLWYGLTAIHGSTRAFLPHPCINVNAN